VSFDTPLTRDAGIAYPIICGAMYPCSNPELVAAASEAGAIGIVQPLSLTYVHGHDYREGLRAIRRMTTRPIGVNALIEQSSRSYRERMQRWVEVSLEEGIRFFVTSLGNPRWVVDLVNEAGGVVYHDVTERKWALKGRDAGVHGLIAVNAEAGGHAGPRNPEALFAEIADLGLPVVCAGGIADRSDFLAALGIGYSGVQVGTRFIATTECWASAEYKNAILAARAEDIVLTERLTGVPVAVIRNDFVARQGTRAGWLARRLLRGRRTKHLMRMVYALLSFRSLKRSLYRGDRERDYWQAGRSVERIHEVVTVEEVVRQMVEPSRESPG
jgi:nitronate monooxygenase